MSSDGAEIQRVVVPLDGSELAEAALGPAVQLAERTAARLVLLTTRWELTAVETVQRYLDARIAFLERDAEPLMVLDSDAPDAILLVAGERGTQVCMATHGRGGLSQTVLGSVAATVIRECPAAVLFVGPHARREWSLPEKPLVIAGFDGSGPSSSGGRAAGALAASIGARVRVLEVARPRDVVAVPKFPAGHVDDLESLVAELRAAGVDADYEVVDGLDPADTLIADVVENDGSLLAVGSHGRSGLGRMLLGSVATRAIRNAPVPVLVAGPRCGVAA